VVLELAKSSKKTFLIQEKELLRRLDFRYFGQQKSQFQQIFITTWVCVTVGFGGGGAFIGFAS